MAKATVRGGRVFLRLDEGQLIIVSGLKELDGLIESLTSDSELDFHHALGIIDNLNAARSELIRRRESRCLERLLSIRS